MNNQACPAVVGICSLCGTEKKFYTKWEWDTVRAWCPNCSEEEGVDSSTLSNDVAESRLVVFHRKAND